MYYKVNGDITHAENLYNYVVFTIFGTRNSSHSVSYNIVNIIDPVI